MKIAIGADHRGFELKEFLKKNIDSNYATWTDVGTFDQQRTDYPLYTLPVCLEVLKASVDCGILICGSGAGMSIAANRFSYIYAALVWNEDVARISKEDDNSNIIVLPADFIDNELAKKIVISWLNAKFKGGRYKKRIDMIDIINPDNIDNNNNNNCCG